MNRPVLLPPEQHLAMPAQDFSADFQDREAPLQHLPQPGHCGGCLPFHRQWLELLC